MNQTMKPVETKGIKWSLKIIKLEFLFSSFLVLDHAVETFGVCLIHGILAVSLPDSVTLLVFVTANAFRSSQSGLPIASVPAPVHVAVVLMAPVSTQDLPLQEHQIGSRRRCGSQNAASGRSAERRLYSQAIVALTLKDSQIREKQSTLENVHRIS